MTNNEVKLIRLYQGVSQKKFAKDHDLSEGTIAKIEAGFVGVSDVTRSKILRKFDMFDPSFIAFVQQMKDTETV